MCVKGHIEADVDGDGKPDIEVNFDREAIKQSKLRSESNR